jgi:hypothetical protein
MQVLPNNDKLVRKTFALNSIIHDRAFSRSILDMKFFHSTELISSYKFLVSIRIAGGLLFRASRPQLAKAATGSFTPLRSIQDDVKLSIVRTPGRTSKHNIKKPTSLPSEYYPHRRRARF